MSELFEDLWVLQSKITGSIYLYTMNYKHSWTNVFDGLLQGAEVVLQTEAFSMFRSSVLCYEAKMETLAEA